MSSDELDVPTHGPHHRVVTAFRCGADNDAQLAWLMARADNAVMVNSTAHFQTLALGIPTACLGRGWFSENGVVRETADLRRALSVGRRPVEGEPSACRAADGAPWRERYLCHMLSRQMLTARYAEPAAVDELMQWIERCGWEARLRRCGDVGIA